VAWIKFEKDLLTDPRVLKIGKSLRARHVVIENPDLTAGEDLAELARNHEPLPDVTLVCGALVRIWSLADTHVDENDVLPLGFNDIDSLIGVPGFCRLMPLEWIEEIDKDSVRLPNYHGHNGTEAKRKAVTQKRVAAFRARNARALPDQTKTKTKPVSSNGAPKNGAPHASIEDSPVLETLPLRDGSAFPVRQSLVAELSPLYPAVDVPQTIREMKGWCIGNPHKQKTREGIKRFITNWLKDEQAKHGG
jgi:hypothetical protein